MRFTKMTGAGNDFIMLDAAQAPRLSADSIRLLCDRRFGIGADGLMLVRRGEPSPTAAARLASAPAALAEPSGGAAESADSGIAPAFSVGFFNADGSGGMLCGNGARCALVYAAAKGMIAYGQAAAFSFAGKRYSGSALGEGYARFELDPRYSTRIEEGLDLGGLIASGRYLDVGSLHFVLDVPELSGPVGQSSGRKLDELDVAALGSALRHHRRFAPEGVNVNFCELEGGILRVRTFERGVEGETLACGTGSTASALSYALRGLVQPPVRVRVRSGAELVIDFDDAAKPTRLSLSGPAKAVFEGEAEPAYFGLEPGA
jgi:diaminopimelate epimerase